MTKTIIIFDATPYRTSHGRMPKGNGMWAFQISGAPDIFFVNGAFIDAKAQARAKASAYANGASRIYVQVMP